MADRDTESNTRSPPKHAVVISDDDISTGVTPSQHVASMVQPGSPQLVGVGVNISANIASAQTTPDTQESSAGASQQSQSSAHILFKARVARETVYVHRQAPQLPLEAQKYSMGRWMGERKKNEPWSRV